MASTRLLAFRTTRGLSQAAVARRAGITPAYLSLLEHRLRRNPTLLTLSRLAEALEVKRGDLL